jgi:hypothetical protein
MLSAIPDTFRKIYNCLGGLGTVATAVSVSYFMVYPNCNSTDFKQFSLIHTLECMNRAADGMDCFLDTPMACFAEDIEEQAGAAFQKWLIRPKGCPYASPIILWLVGFFILHGVGHRGRVFP